MTTRYLLDTNVLSDLVRHPQGRVAERIAAVGEASVCTSIIVATELRYGIERKGSPRLAAQVAAISAPSLRHPVNLMKRSAIREPHAAACARRNTRSTSWGYGLAVQYHVEANQR